MGSKAFRWNRKDLAEVGKVMAVAGISAALVAGLQFAGERDLGVWSPLITSAMTVAIKILQQWSADNSNAETGQ